MIPADVRNRGQEGELVEIPVSSVEPNRFQPRERFDDEALVALGDSIRELGVLQPVLVRRVESDRFELIAGERRWRAARKVGLTSIPAIVRSVDDTSSLEQALVENLHREDLNPLEEAAAYQQLIEDFELTQDAVAKRVGRSRSAIANTLRLLQLPGTIQRLVAEGLVSAGHARSLLASSDRAYQEALAQRIVSEGLSVRETEEAIRRRAELEAKLAGPAEPEPPTTGAGPVPSAAPPASPPPSATAELERILEEFLDTRVSISATGGRGRISIDFADLDDLERIYRLVAGAARGAREDMASAEP